MNDNVTLYDGALLISDAHYGTHRRELETLLDAIIEKKIIVSQLIFMGDIFDLLMGDFKYLIKKNQNLIDKINLLASCVEVIYLEGNHDFCLDTVFSNLRVIPFEEQPLKCMWKNKRVTLAHGDIFSPMMYRLYTHFIRSKWRLKILNIITLNVLNDWLVSWQHDRLIPKKICRDMRAFEQFVNRRIQHYSAVDMIIEGHFHQGKKILIQNCEYIGLPAFACGGKVAKLEDQSPLFVDQQELQRS